MTRFGLRKEVVAVLGRMGLPGLEPGTLAL